MFDPKRKGSVHTGPFCFAGIAMCNIPTQLRLTKSVNSGWLHISEYRVKSELKGVNNMNYQTTDKNVLAQNLTTLRVQKKLSMERVAELIGVSRQAVSKWEQGESLPDLLHCDALAELYGVTLDDLLHFDQRAAGLPVPPKGKHVFGTVQIGERGQIVIPKKARDILGFRQGDTLVVLGDSNPGTSGMALVHSDIFMSMVERHLKLFREVEDE